MRALIQRVSHASVTVEGERVGEIEKGLLVLKNRRISWPRSAQICASSPTRTTR